MSASVATAGHPTGGGRTRLMQGLVLGLLFGLMYLAKRLVPHPTESAATVAALGFLLLAATLVSELVESVGLPHLTGYLLAGIVAGPYVLHLIDHQAVESLSQVNTLALALIALSGGAELRLALLKKVVKSLTWATLVQTMLVAVVMTGVFLAVRPWLPFARALPWRAAVGAALLWGVVAISRSPSAALGILSQTRAHGPLSTFSLAFIMTSDVVVVITLAFAMAVARPLIEPGSVFSVDELWRLGEELLASVSVGTCLGLFIAAYVRLVNRQLIVILVALGFGATELLKYLRFDALLAFLVAGFVVQNLSKQGPAFLHAIERMAGAVYVLFFAIAGAHLNIPLLRVLGPIAVILAITRAGATWVASRLACRFAGDAPVLKRWAWSSLISQAGFALGLAVLVEGAFPSFGAGFRALAIATIALNEVFGPILFKFALDRAGESASEPPAYRTSLADAEGVGVPDAYGDTDR